MLVPTLKLLYNLYDLLMVSRCLLGLRLYEILNSGTKRLFLEKLLRANYSTYLKPPCSRKYNFSTCRLRLAHSLKVPDDISRRVFFRPKTGFITYAKNVLFRCALQMQRCNFFTSVCAPDNSLSYLY